jgi:predicted metal-dependent phosphoesterase TrpH
MMPLLRADLHVHSYHSGTNGDLPFLRSRDCYSDPEAVYRTAKARGMDLVTITDHDSIDGCLELLDRFPDAADFIMGEEVSCWFPDAPLEVHFGVYGITERAHRELQPLRRNAFEVAAYLRREGLFFSLNHLFHFYREQVPFAKYMELVMLAPGFEARNGAMLPRHNDLIEELLGRDTAGAKMAPVAGSDAHTLRRIGRTWTSVPARDRREFMQNLAAGQGRPGGTHGGTLPLAADIYGVIVDYWVSLSGLRRSELRAIDRLVGGAFSIATLPFEFVPLLIAWWQKRDEARTLERFARDIAAAPAFATLSAAR